jgi:nucleotide-binding universal stress UspA family protein
MKTFQHILVPTDFSESARDALRAAREIARGTPCRLSLIHVISDAWRQPWTADAGVDLVSFQREWQEEAQQRLQVLITEEGLSGASVTRAVLIGTPHAAIRQYADEHHVDLIVMGSHGHGPLHRFLLGSVAERVVRTARCPVLTVPLHSLLASNWPRDGEEPVLEGAGTSTDRAVDDQC